MYRLICLLVLSLPAFAMQRGQGYCENGAQVVVTGGVNSTTQVQRSFPSCTVTVYFTGTTALVTLYSDNSSTPLANPFTATTTGYWGFYAANGRYDVRLSGASISVPFLIYRDILLDDSAESSFTSITSGTNTTAAMIVGSGSSLTRSGSGIIDANKILNTTLTSLTGVGKWTAGVPGIANSANIIALWTGSCSASTVLFGDGSCAATGNFYQRLQINAVNQNQRVNLNFTSQFTNTDSAGSNRSTVDLATTITANTSGNAATASALDHNPTACPTDEFVNDVSAAVVLACAQLAAANLSNGTTGSGAVVLAASPAIVTPTIASFVNATHNHTNAAGGGTLGLSAFTAAGLFSQTASVTVGNTTSETTILGAGAGSLTLQANYLTVGRTVKVFVQGVHSATGGPTARVRVKLGGTTLLDTGAVTSTNQTDGSFAVEATITCRSTGVTGTVFAQGFYLEGDAVTSPFSLAATGTATINTTTTNAIDVTYEWGTMAVGNTVTATNALVNQLY